MKPIAQRDPTFALALGGGGARGLAHIPVIEALDDLGIRPVAVSGSSIGAIIGAGVAAGMSGREIRDHCRHVLGSNAEVAARMWRSRPTSLSEMMQAGMRLGQFNIERILHAFLPEAVPSRFEDLAIPLGVVATDFFAHDQLVLEKGELVPALAASAAIPGLFRPIRHEDRLLVDGGICNPVPFDLLKDKADIVIAVDVVGFPTGAGSRPVASVDLLLGASQIMMHAIIALKLQHSRPDILLRPEVSSFRVLDFLKVERVLSESAAIADEVKQSVAAAIGRFEAAQE